MGLYDEQVVESFHQEVKKQLRILASVPKDKLLDTLFFRLHNISQVTNNYEATFGQG